MTDKSPAKSMEVWKPIAGYEGYYEVSNHGRVRSLDRTIPHKRCGTYRAKGRTLKPSAGTDYMPYHIVTLNKLNKCVMPYVHTLVLEAFVGPRPKGLHGCHNDGNPANNRLDNLRWDTPEANQADSVKHGTHAGSRFRRLTPEQKVEIIKLRAEGESAISVAKIVGCCRKTVDRICNASSVY